MKIVVTGGAGFIGSSFVRRAVRDGHEVAVIDALTYAGHLQNIEGIYDSIRFFHGAIQNAAFIKKVFTEFRPNLVFNFAAETHVDRSILVPPKFWESNSQGVLTMLEEVRTFFARLSCREKTLFRYIQISTDEVFGDLGDDDLPFAEDSCYRPSSPYAASKASADHLVRAWQRTYGIPTLIAHSCNNYGPRQFPEKLIPKSITRLLAGQSISVYGSGLNRREWLHVEDFCDGLMALAKIGVVGESYCFGSGNEMTNLDLIQQIGQVLVARKGISDFHRRIEFVVDRPGHDHRYAVNSAKVKRELGFEARKDFREGLRETVEWYLTHPNWVQAMLANEPRPPHIVN